MWMVNLGGLLLIALIVWWFWLYHPGTDSLASEELVILVENGTYSPARIKVAAQTPLRLTFMRKDPSPCAETLLFPALQLSETLPLNKARTVQLPALAPGEYAFHCQMQMYRGTLLVEQQG
ncbi:cupredoxin domain-containing protein [Shewanella cyperi]|uniref:cupredoxin domain-containing protein n=1 Tax=Shewanella cyperi TaxID=2814292 RepID=UPI001A93D349|nr:cupredoxin domain-containing protein [Shewanella cyperi]QSX40097.1 cupredoxin domain-containing protein [Shewanella cyperi]